MKPHTLAALLAAFAFTPSYAGPAPVLVELFTSQGCSSCPPAEAWLNGEGMELFRQGKILPLVFHVDYWDYLGWKDPFSSSDFTKRQRAYARVLASDSLYTPEMVVGGLVGFVGSDRARVRDEILAAEKNLTGAIELKRVSQGKELEIIPPRGLPKKGTRFYLAVFENGLRTHVVKGENKGRTLIENFVVRRFVEIPVKTGPFRIALSDLPEGEGGRQGAAVFAQDAAMRVLAQGCLYGLK